MLQEPIISQLRTLYDRFLVPIDDPTSRLFYINFIFVFIFIVIWLALNQQKINFLIFKKLIFNKKYWWNRSTKTDYKIYIFNSLIKVFILIPYLDFSFSIGLFTVQKLNQLLILDSPLTRTHWPILFFSISYFIFDDFLRFLHHYLMHKIPFLWHFHKTHHSAKILTPITLYRAHPVEIALATFRNSLSLGLATGVFVYLFHSQLTFFTLFGVHFMGFAFNFLGSNLRHSHIPISFGALEYIFISPYQHQIHHSVRSEHFDSNFGVSLSIWDQIFKSCKFSKNEDKTKKLKFGV